MPHSNLIFFGLKSWSIERLSEGLFNLSLSQLPAHIFPAHWLNRHFQPHKIHILLCLNGRSLYPQGFFHQFLPQHKPYQQLAKFHMSTLNRTKRKCQRSIKWSKMAGKFTALVFFMYMPFSSTFAQVPPPWSSGDSIKVLTGIGLSYFQHGSELTFNQALYRMREDEEALEQMKRARSAKSFGSFVGGVGGFMLGWPIGTALGGGDPNWMLAGIGAGLIALSIPISAAYRKNVLKAVKTYNRGLPRTSFRERREWRMSLSENGIGLTLQF